jgi:DNA transposition AAA+ family ATPase
MTYDEARNAVLEYRKNTGKSQADISRELGLDRGGAALSQFLNGKYPAPGKIVEKIAALLSVAAVRAVAPKDPPFKKTSISAAVINLITYCHIQGKIGVAYGDAGVGKTMACRQYKKENPTAIFITVKPSYATISGINELLGRALHIRGGVARRVESEIIDKLRGSNGVIIVDEAQHLTVRVINHLRCIVDDCYDEDKGGLGLALVGNEEIYTKMKGAGQRSYAQLFSRIGNRQHLLTDKITQEDIALVFEEASLNSETSAILHKIARSEYGLRGAVNVFVNTLIVYEISDYSNLTAGKIARIAKEMNVG